MEGLHGLRSGELGDLEEGGEEVVCGGGLMGEDEDDDEAKDVVGRGAEVVAVEDLVADLLRGWFWCIWIALPPLYVGVG